MFFVSKKPQLHDDASKIRKWRNAMSEELKMIKKKRTWILVGKLKKKNTNGVK